MLELSFTAVLFDSFTYYYVVEIDISNCALKKKLIDLYGDMEKKFASAIQMTRQNHN